MGDFADARGYERLMGRWSDLIARELVRFAGLRDGERVLDVGCGTGALSAAIVSAARVGGLVGVDPSPDFVAAARQRIREPRARFETGDAQRLAFADGAFDATLSLLVLNFVPDRARAAAEMRRVTRPVGRVVACVWDYAGEMTMLRRFWDAAAALDPAAAPRHEGRMPLCRSGELAELWRSAGLEAVREDAITVATRFASFADYWEPFLTGVGPSGAYASSLPPKEQRALEARLRAELWEDRPDGQRTFPARAWVAAGTVPA